MIPQLFDMRKFIVPIPTYRAQLEVIIGSRKKLVKQEAKILKVFDAETDGFNAAGRCYQVYLKKNIRTVTILITKDFLTLNILIHECLHAVFYLLRYLDIQPSEEAEEAYTYLMEYLFTYCYTELKSELLPLK